MSVPVGSTLGSLMPTEMAMEKVAKLRAEVEQEIAGVALAPWEKDYCHWLAVQSRPSKERQLEVASALAGTQLYPTELDRLRSRRAFRELWHRLRGEFEQEINEAKEKFASLLPKAAEVYERMIDKVDREEDVRAAPALLVPLLDRAWAKREEKAPVAPSVHIHLSTNQIAGLQAPVMVVEAKEVKPQLPATTSGTL